MFDIESVPVALRRIGLKIADVADASGDPDRQRLCDCTFRVPLLSYDLAKSVRVPIVTHCYGRDRLPLLGIHDVTFEPPADRYTVTLHSAPDADPVAVLMLATVTKVRVWRPNHDKRDLAMEFVTRHELTRGDAHDLADLLNAWSTSDVRITLAAVQMSIPLHDADDDDDSDEPPTTDHRRRAAH